MATAGDTFITTLRQAHLDWGRYRHTLTRGIVPGEGYLQIPLREARRLNIHNSNRIGAIIEYSCTSVDGFFAGAILKASGCFKAGDIYAKQFQGRGNLQRLGDWFSAVHAKVGDRVQITWTSPTDIIIEKL